MYGLLTEALGFVPKNSAVRDVVTLTMELCSGTDDIKEVLCELLSRYGHPDCTNMLQNTGITVAALLKGWGDMIRTGMLALNCGFDTDCTCATAGAILGTILGASKLETLYGWKDIKYVLGVRASRRSDLVKDLADDIATLAVVIFFLNIFLFFHLLFD